VDLFRAGEASEQGHFAVATYRMEDRLPLVQCPGLLLYSAKDPFSAPERSEPFRRAFRPATEVMIDAGIFCANEAPELFAGAVLGWLRG
jgi:pimeloyl-ACP methyl ester carboxylesterase